MKDQLSIQELKALCRLFFTAGMRRQDRLTVSAGTWEDRGGAQTYNFEDFFNLAMQGKYDKSIAEEALKLKWLEIEKDMGKEIDKLNTEDKIKATKAAEAVQELRNIIIC